MVLFNVFRSLFLVLSCNILVSSLPILYLSYPDEDFSPYRTNNRRVVPQTQDTGTTNVFDNTFQHHVSAEILSCDNTTSVHAENFKTLVFNEDICLKRSPRFSCYFKKNFNALLDILKDRLCSLLDCLIIGCKKMEIMYQQYTKKPVVHSAAPNIYQTFITTVSHVTNYKPTVTVTLTPSTITKTVIFKVPKFIVRTVETESLFAVATMESLPATTQDLPVVTKTAEVLPTKTGILHAATEYLHAASKAHPITTSEDMFLKLQVKLPDWFSYDIYPRVLEHIKIILAMI